MLHCIIGVLLCGASYTPLYIPGPLAYDKPQVSSYVWLYTVPPNVLAPAPMFNMMGMPIVIRSGRS